MWIFFQTYQQYMRRVKHLIKCMYIKLCQLEYNGGIVTKLFLRMSKIRLKVIWNYKAALLTLLLIYTCNIQFNFFKAEQKEDIYIKKDKSDMMHDMYQ